MKFNYKKIASVFASAVMLSSTIGFAAAANYPAPFTDGAAVIYGAAGDQTDFTAAVDIFDQLSARVNTPSSDDVTVMGEAKPVETASQPLYLGDYMNTTKQTFSKDQLPSVLANGKITDDDGKELDYELKVDTLNTTIIYGETPDNVDDTIYADLEDSKYAYVMKIVFPTAVNMSLLTDESIKLFGKDYTFSGSVSQITNDSIKLFEKAVSVIVNDGEEVVAEGHTINVAVEDSNTASITIDGTTESHDEGWSGKVGGVDVYLKNVVGPNVAGSSRFIELYLNSNKLTLAHGEEVTLGSSDLSGTLVKFSDSAGKTTQLNIIVQPYEFDDQIKYLTVGESFTDPVFGSLKFELSSLTPELMADTRDEIIIKPSGENTASIAFTNKAGKAYDMDMIRISDCALNSTRGQNDTADKTCGAATTLGTHTYNMTTLGVGSKYKLITSTTTNADLIDIAYENDYFITCSNEYTQIWRVISVKNTSTTKEIKVKDQGTDSETVTVTLNSADIGAEGTLSLADGNTETLYMYNNSAINVSGCSYLYTKNGARIDLHEANAPYGNLSEIVIQEETAYNGGAFTDNGASEVGKNLTIRFDWVTTDRSGKDITVRDVMAGTAGGGLGTVNTDWWTDDVGDYANHYVTKYGSYMISDGQTDKVVKTYYPENAMKLGFYIGEVSSEITPGSTGTGSGQISIKKDSEVDAVKDKHLIVVGGSCINTVAAKILDSTSPLCDADFTAVTQVSSGGYIIKTITSPYNDAKVAMLVAGYDAADTITAVKRAMVLDGVSTEAGAEEIFPVVA